MKAHIWERQISKLVIVLGGFNIYIPIIGVIIKQIKINKGIQTTYIFILN